MGWFGFVLLDYYRKAIWMGHVTNQTPDQRRTTAAVGHTDLSYVNQISMKP